MPSPRSVARQRDDRLGRLAQRIERGDLRADVHVHADRQQPAPRAISRNSAGASSIGTPNLLT